MLKNFESFDSDKNKIPIKMNDSVQFMGDIKEGQPEYHDYYVFKILKRGG